VNIEDIPCTSEAIRRLLSLGADEMPDAAGIKEFNYQPPAPASAAAESGAAREVSEAIEAGVGPETVADGGVKEAPPTAETAPSLPDPPEALQGDK
jgi:hypothetical protein